MNSILQQYVKLVEFLGKVLGPDYEIALHDLTEGNYSVIAIANGFNSNRTVGAPLTQKALSFIREDICSNSDYQIRYPGLTPQQSETISSTLFIKDDDGTLIGMLCINYNTRRGYAVLEQAMEVLNLLPSGFSLQLSDLRIDSPSAASSADGTSAGGICTCHEDEDNEIAGGGTSSGETPEVFSASLEDLIQDIAQESVPADTPPARFNQAEKLEIVRKLRDNGIFSIKGAVHAVAAYLHCSEPSVYRYLKSI